MQTTWTACCTCISGWSHDEDNKRYSTIKKLSDIPDICIAYLILNFAFLALWLKVGTGSVLSTFRRYKVQYQTRTLLRVYQLAVCERYSI